MGMASMHLVDSVAITDPANSVSSAAANLTYTVSPNTSEGLSCSQLGRSCEWQTRSRLAKDSWEVQLNSVWDCKHACVATSGPVDVRVCEREGGGGSLKVIHAGQQGMGDGHDPAQNQDLFPFFLQGMAVG